MKKETMVLITAILAVLVIFAAYQATISPVTGSEERGVRNGSKVQVDYIGMLAPEYGSLVFDTSIYDVAADNITYPKVATFKLRDRNQYKPLMVHVGEASEGGYTKVVDGFSEGLVGMKPGETRTIVVSPEKGYGNGDPSLIKTLPLVENVKMRETYSTKQFGAYFNAEPYVGEVVEHPLYHWPIVVENLFENYVIVRNEPETGKEYSTEGWNIRVLDVDSTADGGNGTITIKHLITKEDEFRTTGTGYIKGIERTFILTDVNETAGTYTIDYNEVTRGRTLVFWVKLISIDVY